MQVAPKRRKKPAAPEAGLNPVQVAPTRNPPRPAPEAEPKLPPRVAEAGRNSAGGAIRSIREPLNPIVFNHHQPAPLSRRFPGGRGEIRSEIVSLPTPLLFDSKTTSNCHSFMLKSKSCLQFFLNLFLDLDDRLGGTLIREPEPPVGNPGGRPGRGQVFLPFSMETLR